LIDFENIVDLRWIGSVEGEGVDLLAVWIEDVGDGPTIWEGDAESVTWTCLVARLLSSHFGEIDIETRMKR
jgi:hypothetical protein